MRIATFGRSMAAVATAILLGSVPTGATTTIISFRSAGSFDFSAPGTTDYTIVIAGAAGGDSYTYRNQRDVLSAYGGAGAIAFGTFHLDAGTLLEFNVGTRGRDGSGGGGGGGGAATTFFTTGQILQMIAGGGGGAGYRQDGLPGGYLPSGTTTGDAAPGTTGAGGQAGHSTFVPFGDPDAPGAGGGAGLYTAGGSNPTPGGGSGGAGSHGGATFEFPFGYGGSGGIAGGAGSYSGRDFIGTAGAGGGGGGYSGGAGGDSYLSNFYPLDYAGRAGGGGGSYNRAGGSTGISGGANGGDGFIQITFDYTAPPPPPPPPPPPVGAVPEPSSWVLLIAGFGMVGATARRRRPVFVAT